MQQTVIPHHWVHRRHQKGRCKQCGKSFQSKLSFGNKVRLLSCVHRLRAVIRVSDVDECIFCCFTGTGAGNRCTQLLMVQVDVSQQGKLLHNGSPFGNVQTRPPRRSHHSSLVDRETSPKGPSLLRPISNPNFISGHSLSDAVTSGFPVYAFALSFFSLS